MVWRPSRKQRKVEPVLDPVEQMTVRVAHRICGVVYGGGNQACACKIQGRGMCCDNMKLAAQHAFSEIMGD